MQTFWWIMFFIVGVPVFWFACYQIVKSLDKGGGS